MIKNSNWTSPSFKNTKAADIVPQEAMDVEFVILLQGNNLFGDAIYSYVKMTGTKLKEVFAKMQINENFKPSDFGEVISAGRGEPTQEVRDEMAAGYNMTDVPLPKPLPKPNLSQPKFFGDEEA